MCRSETAPGWPYGERPVLWSFLSSCGGKGGVTGHTGNGIGAGCQESLLKKVIHHKKNDAQNDSVGLREHLGRQKPGSTQTDTCVLCFRNDKA